MVGPGQAGTQDSYLTLGRAYLPAVSEGAVGSRGRVSGKDVRPSFESKVIGAKSPMTFREFGALPG